MPMSPADCLSRPVSAELSLLQFAARISMDWSLGSLTMLAEARYEAARPCMLTPEEGLEAAIQLPEIHLRRDVVR